MHYFRGKRVFVTGHTGFKGSWLTRWLLHLGAEVGGFSLYIPSEPSHFEKLGLKNKIRHYDGDVCDIGQLSSAVSEFKPEIFFHLAAQPIVRRSYEERKITFDTNVGGTVNVLEAILSEHSVRSAVIITSDKCYENVEWEYGYRETDRLGGKDPYSASKACAEIVFSSYARCFFSDPSSARIATARAGNVIGGGDWAQDRLIPDLMRSWSRSEEAVLRNPQSTRPWQHVLEPLSGYLWLALCLGKGSATSLSGEAFNFGPHGWMNHNVGTVTADMSKYWQQRRWKKEGDLSSKKHEAGLLKLNCEKAQTRLGWMPSLNYEECVRFTAEWYRNYYAGDLAEALTLGQIQEYEKLGAERQCVWSTGRNTV